MKNPHASLLRLCLGTLLAGAVALAPAAAQTSTQTKPAGAHAHINTTLAQQAMRGLGSDSASERRRTVAQIEAAPQRYAPPVFYALSHVMRAEGQPERAMFWFYAGQLRARFDANRCADVSARQAVAVLNDNYGTPVNRYAVQHLPLLEQTVAEVLDWDRRTPHDYDHRWINLHGMNAIVAAMGGQGTDGAALSLPESEWEALAEQTRQRWQQEFAQAMARFRDAPQAGSAE